MKLKNFIQRNIQIKRVSQTEQKAARRYLIVLLSALFFVLLPVFPSALLVGVLLSKWLGPTVELIEAPILIFAMVIVCLIGGIIGAIIWGVLMSFYLTIEEYKELSHIQSFYIPALTPLAKWIDNKVLMWKIDRERKKTS